MTKSEVKKALDDIRDKLIHEGKYVDAIQKFKDEFGYPV